MGRVCEPAWYTLNDRHGVARWPAVPLELVFNALMLAVILVLRRQKLLTGQHFHLYLIAYGAFRFAHEFLRDTPAIVGPLSGYQIASAALVVLGVAGFMRRRDEPRLAREI